MDTTEKDGGIVSLTTTLAAVDGPRLVTVIVKVTLLVNGVEPGTAILENAKSASGLTVVFTDAVLFAGTVSVPAELVMLTMFETAPSTAEFNVRVRLATPLLAMFPTFQVTTPFV